MDSISQRNKEMRIYDLVEEKWITENEINNIAPPERYIYVDVPNLEPECNHNSLDKTVAALDYCIVDKCKHCLYFNKGCIDSLLKDAKYYLEQYKKSLEG